MFSRLTAGSGESRKSKEEALETQIEQLKKEAEEHERISTYAPGGWDRYHVDREKERETSQ